MSLIQYESNVPQTKEVFKEILKSPGKIFDMFRIDLNQIAEKVLCQLLKAELTIYLKRDKYEHTKEQDPNYRNGYSDRKYFAKHIGGLELKIPRDRNGEFKSHLLNKYDRYEKELEKDVSLMFLTGQSTRSIELVSKAILGKKISKSEVSKINKELMTGIDKWRLRRLEKYEIKYMFMDGVNFHIRVGDEVEIVPMLVVIGVTKDNRRLFLALQQGDKEKAGTWREIFKDLKLRGMDKDKVKLGVMDGLPGLEMVFREEFPKAKVQRCQVHVMNNVLTKTPRNLRVEVKDGIRDIFYALSRNKAKEAYKEFVKRYKDKIPSAVKCLENVIDRCLTFFSFPNEEWISLRTSNIIERVNKEFKRRTKSMEILAGEASAYRLLSFIAVKMEINWRRAPFGKSNLPCIKKFTQNC